ncbi:hypothetical protein ACFV6E_13385 [Streptomyces sp. NPDC059785]|uniref:hypothetical protein n=1 Tax=Streptomyces sp. NPDC059785 TaxID=3346945 RepID=UPI00365FF62B
MSSVVGIAVLDDKGAPHMGTRRPGQALFQDGIVEDRKNLLAGLLTYESHVDSDVGETATTTVTLKALSRKAAEARDKETSLARRNFKVGGVQGASLASASADVTVKPLSDARTQQVIAAPGDEARWQWSVTADKPGDYDLTLSVTTYQGESSRALTTLNPPVTIHLTAANTASYRFSVARGWLIAAGGLVGVLGVFWALRGPVVTYTRARKEARREKEARGEDGYM